LHSNWPVRETGVQPALGFMHVHLHILNTDPSNER